MTLTQNIALDVARETALHIAGKQFDENSRFLLVTIKEAGEEKSIPAGSTITLNARRPDGSAQSFAGSIQDGKALVEIDQWILEQYGTVYCSVSVVDSSASKLTTLSFRLLVERAEGSGFVLVYVAAANLAAGTYYITMAGVAYSFTTTQAVPAGGKIYFSSNGTTGKTTNNGATIETLTLTAGSTGTELQGSDVVNFLVQMQANVAAIDAELDSKADKSAIEENLTAGTSLATIDPNSYTPSTSPYLYRISPSGKRCEYDVIGGTVGWNQYCQEYPTTTADGITLINDGNGKLTASGISSAGSNHYFIFYSLNKPFYKNHKYFVTIGDLTSDNVASVILRNRTTSTNYASISIRASHGNYALVNAVDDGIMYYYLNYPYANTTITGTICPMVIDLTTLLGSTIADYAYTLEQATAGSGIAWLKSFGFLTKSYYPFCEPTLESVQATARVARGINLFDKATMFVDGKYISDSNGNANPQVGASCTDFIEVFPSTAYYIQTDATSGRWGAWYDADQNFISGIVGAGVQTAPTNARYIRFTINHNSSSGGNPDTFCINISNPTINGQYFPYESHTYPLGNTTLRGIPKLDSSNNIYYDGDRRKADGTIIRNISIRNFATDVFTLTKVSSDASNYSYYVSANNLTGDYNIRSNRFVCATSPNVSLLQGGEMVGSATYKVVYLNFAGLIGTNNVATAKQWMIDNAVVLYYLATPTTESADPFTPIQYTGSTEAFTTSNDVPVGVEGKYYTDLTLPKLPTTNGTYTLKCTVTDGTGIVSWASE